MSEIARGGSKSRTLTLTLLLPSLVGLNTAVPSLFIERAKNLHKIPLLAKKVVNIMPGKKAFVLWLF